MKRHARFGITIDNLPQIMAAYSEGTAGRVLHEVWSRIETALISGRWEVTPEAWGISLSSTDACAREIAWDEIETAIHSVAIRPIRAGNVRLVVGLSCGMRQSTEQADTVSAIDAEQYRLDMRVAAAAYSALASGRVIFAEQPIADASVREKNLYRECLARLADGRGELIGPGAFLPAIERLGLTRAFDRQIVSEILQQLRRRPTAVLGCNISALSAVKDVWWNSILATLALEPDLAERLVIEITETALPPSIDHAVEFVTAIRATGGRVALDDFGAGFSMISFARRGGVDIIKIDSSYLKLTSGARLLHNLIMLARDFARDVVIEGIETAEDLQRALEAGADWVQGYFLAVPSAFVAAAPADLLVASLDETVRVIQ